MADKNAQREFKVLAPFTVKAPTMSPANPENMDNGGNEVVKISGYANFSGLIEEGEVFIDLVGDVVVPSGIDISVWKSNPQILLQHDRKCTIGRGLTVTKKKDGLFIEAEVHAGAMCEEDFYRVKAGLLCYFSVGFRTVEVDYKKVGEQMVCFITKSLLLEVSVVGIPANSASSFQVIKSLPEGAGFYAGDLNSTDFSTPIENENHKQFQEMETPMKFTIKLKDLLSNEEASKLKELGLEAKLEEETEIDAKSFIESIVAAKLKSLKEDIIAELTPAQTTDEEVKSEEGAEGVKSEEVVEEVKSEEVTTESTTEEIDAIKSLKEQLALIKKELEVEETE